MTLRIHLFARAKDLAGTDTLTLDAPLGCTVADVRRLLAAACPALAGLLSRCALAVNYEFAHDATIIIPDAALAVLPPVSGGQTLAEQ